MSAPSSTPRRALGFACWAALALVVGAWLADALGGGLPAAADRVLVVAAIVLWVVRCGLWVARALTTGPGWTAERTLLALLLVALPVGLTGVDFELLDHPRNDEGVFYATAQRVNMGEVLPETFNYGHLPYYIDALLLWTYDLFPEATTSLTRAVYGVDKVNGVPRLVLRSSSGLMGGLTVVPVFWAAYRIAGLGAGAMAGLLIVFASVYIRVAHSVISDVPAGFFAACCLPYCARLMERERPGDYVRAGIASGLAAASKYPGGVVALAIVAVWVGWRVRTRRWSWGLVVGGAASLATFLAVMPALWIDWSTAFQGKGLDLLFGFRQYAHGGWLGVMPDSLALWYGQQLAESFGWAALLAGFVGLAWAGRTAAWRLISVAPFAAGYLLLISAMKMGVLRNLQPVLPAVAVILGVGLAAWRLPLGRLPAAARRWAPAVLAAAVLAVPATSTILLDLRYTRPGTRQLAAEWIAENVVQGAGIFGEDYTPRPDDKRYHWYRLRFITRLPEEKLLSGEWDYLLLADAAHHRFLELGDGGAPGQQATAAIYRRLLELPVAAEFLPGPLTEGPTIRVYRADPPAVEFRTERRFRPADAHFVLDPDRMRPRGQRGPIHFTRRLQYAVFKEYFAAGEYEATAVLRPVPREAILHVTTRDRRDVGELPLLEAPRFVLPEPGKYLFRTFVAPPARLHGFEVRRVGPVPGTAEGDAESPPLP